MSPADTEQAQIDLAREIDAATQVYDRIAWICYATIFLAIPFVVLVFRLHMEAWHYYLAGALFVAGALLVSAMDIAVMAKCDEINQRAQRCGNCSQ